MEPVNDPHLYSNRYQVTHLIARGGMALVYRAQDRLLNRPVALKILYPELSNDPSFVERFRREAQAAANLSHPNIVPVFDWGEDEGTYFIVMELVDGASLAEQLRGGGTVQPQRAATIAASVAAALGYAHRNGVVHRDVKPGNILLTSDGQVKVTDFGIAQAVAAHDNLASADVVMGTATYFSPEQAEGRALDGRSDVYSLGIVLYEMLAGRPPFVGDEPVEVSRQHVHATTPPPTSFNPTIPSDLEAIVMEALSKSAGGRYASADELRADLLRFTEGQPVRSASGGGAFAGADATRAVQAVGGGERTQAVPIMTGPRTDIKRRRRSRVPLVTTIAIVLLAVGGFGYFYVASRTPTSMPNVVGQAVSQATATLRGDGLVIGTTTQVQSSQPAGTVVSTNPSAGQHIFKGESVTLQVSLGNSTQPVTIPDTTTMTLSDAENTLQTVGLSYKVVFTQTAPANGASPDTVLSQSPVGGTNGHTGDVITLTVLAPGVNFQMPDLSNDTPLAAATALGQLGLTVSTQTSSQCSNTVAQGNVAATNPAKGAPIKAGTSVVLITSSGYCQVVVPNVEGQTQAAASSALSSQGLVPSFTTAVAGCSTANAGTVVSQSVAPGSSTLYNSTVDLTVCPGGAG